MSMICWVLGLTPAQISALRATPSLVSNLVLVIHDDESKARFDEATKGMSSERRKRSETNRATFEASPEGREWQARLAEARERVAALGAFERALDLEKLWHILHYLFTGHVGPANAPGDLLLTGEGLGEDVGYGPARLHGPTETRDFRRFLDTQDLPRLQARVNRLDMRRLGVYPAPLERDSEYEGQVRDGVAFYFPQLRDYVRRMSDKGNGLLTWVF